MASITTEQIKEHRQKRKTAGLVGCIDGSDTPLTSLRGISWRPEDPMNPYCFCHDCRTLWDPEGSIDLELIENGHRHALFVYRSILLPIKKDILRTLRCKTDTALEDAVKAQATLVLKIQEIEALRQTYHKKNASYSSMASGGYTVLKMLEPEMDKLSAEMDTLHDKIALTLRERTSLETRCTETSNALASARMTEREFMEEHF